MFDRLSALLCVAALAVGAGLLSAAPAVAVPTRSQAVTFTSNPPADGTTWASGNPLFSYLAQASATSGLPVTFSIDPSSADVCRFADVSADHSHVGNDAWIQWAGAGTCTIHADQAGNEDYLPAEQATLSFVIERVVPRLTSLRARRGVPGGTPATFWATLQGPAWGAGYSEYWAGYPGQTITFSVAGKPVCSGTTDAQGVATCRARLTFGQWTRLRFTAFYGGDRLFEPVSANGYLLG